MWQLVISNSIKYFFRNFFLKQQKQHIQVHQTNNNNKSRSHLFSNPECPIFLNWLCKMIDSDALIFSSKDTSLFMPFGCSYITDGLLIVSIGWYFKLTALRLIPSSCPRLGLLFFSYNCTDFTEGRCSDPLGLSYSLSYNICLLTLFLWLARCPPICLRVISILDISTISSLPA